MNIKGEYLFESFDEALKFVNKPTNYEKEKEIFVVSCDIVLDLKDLKLVAIKKSDKTLTLAIFFKNSTKYDIWKFWIPSEAQFNAFPYINSIIKDIEARNKGVKYG